jgi:murein DD-endopeptidase MepM/ murein hydrolase activator NlpD
MQGVHAMASPGVYPLVIQGELENGVSFGFSQKVLVTPGDYIFESLNVPTETLDPAITGPEDEIWYSVPLSFSPDKLWQGVFLRPVAPSDCGYTSLFGNRRSYNGSTYNYFHTGLDFCYNYNLEINEIYAPANGLVVFAGEMVVRGNATIIDHGWGVYTAYMHQAEIKVEEGERVKAGQVIGVVGGTGRVNGPHLHFEVWVGGVQVDPLDWLDREYP